VALDVNSPLVLARRSLARASQIGRLDPIEAAQIPDVGQLQELYFNQAGAYALVSIAESLEAVAAWVNHTGPGWGPS